MAIYNCTPHAIVVRKDDGSDTTFPPSGKVVRMPTETKVVYTVDGIPVSRTSFGQPEGWPDAGPNDIVIVSTIVAQNAGQQKFAVVAPDTGPTAIRVDGQVVAVRGFQTFTPPTETLEQAARRAGLVAEKATYVLAAASRLAAADSSDEIDAAADDIAAAVREYAEAVEGPLPA